MEIVELDNHPYYVGVQYHPEYLSRPLKPSPPFMGLILASVGKLQSYINHGCRLSPREMSDISSGMHNVATQTELESELDSSTAKSKLNLIKFPDEEEDKITQANVRANDLAIGLSNGLAKVNLTNGTSSSSAEEEK